MLMKKPICSDTTIIQCTILFYLMLDFPSLRCYQLLLKCILLQRVCLKLNKLIFNNNCFLWWKLSVDIVMRPLILIIYAHHDL